MALIVFLQPDTSSVKQVRNQQYEERAMKDPHAAVPTSLIEQLNQDKGIYALVIAGQGEKFFSAGADLNQFAEGDKRIARVVSLRRAIACDSHSVSCKEAHPTDDRPEMEAARFAVQQGAKWRFLSQN